MSVTTIERTVWPEVMPSYLETAQNSAVQHEVLKLFESNADMWYPCLIAIWKLRAIQKLLY